MKLSVHGSRDLEDERVKIILLEEIEKHNIEEIVTHGEPGGACKVARDLCREKAIPLKLYYLNFKFLRGAFEHRSKDVLNNADRAVFIHDGQSKGTENEYKLAQKINIPHTYYKLKKVKHKESVGFPVLEEWGLDEKT